MDLNFFSITLLVSGVIVAGISTIIIYRLQSSVRWFAFTMLLVSLWAFAYGIELASTTYDTMVFWIKIQYIGIAFAPGTMLWFCLKYTGLEKYLNPKILTLVFFIPVLTFLLVMSNPFHHLHYRALAVDYSGSFPLMAITPGPWYFVHVVFFYLSLFGANALMFFKFKTADPIFKRQSNLLIMAGFFPWTFNLVFLLGFRPFGHIDLTPYAFLITYIFVGIGLLRFDLFRIKPIARDKVFGVITKGILVFDPNGKIIDFNTYISKIIEKPEISLIGKMLKDVFGEATEIENYLNRKEKDTIEITLKLGGAQKDLSIEFVPIHESKNIFMGMMLIFEDITLKKSVEKQLIRQAGELKNLIELKDKLFTIISHDLKGPIFGIRELIKLSFEGTISQDEFMRVLPEINKNMDSVSILLENLLAWTSTQLKGEMMEKSYFEIDQLVQPQISLFEKTAKEKGITLRIQKYGNLMVFADKNMIDFVIRNLISNALKFSGMGDFVTIILKENEDNISIKIKDTGMGISKDNLQKIENRISFTTLGNNKETGTGLGLLLVFDYVAKNGGKLNIQSRISEGSELYFDVPKREFASTIKD